MAKLMDEIDELSKAVVSKWHPIETAPKNGLPIVAIDVDGDKWLPACIYWDRLIGNWCTCDGVRVFMPDYWMPLPQPPEIKP